MRDEEIRAAALLAAATYWSAGTQTPEPKEVELTADRFVKYIKGPETHRQAKLGDYMKGIK